MGATSAAEGVSQILPPFHYLHHRMDEFAALPLAFFAAQLKLCVAALAWGKKKERHISLIEDREVQQLYDEIMRQPEARSTLERCTSE